MSYVRTTWQNGDTITAAKLNNIETGILGNESDISNVNTNLGNDISALQGTVASTYDSTSTYAVGDYVYYSGDLYRCSTAIATAEAWTAAHWTAVVLGDDVSSLKSALDDVVIISGTEPSSANNKIWVKSNSNSEQIPTYVEYLDLINASLIRKSATGEIAQFSDGASNIPIRNLTVDSSATSLQVCGKNLFDKSVTSQQIDGADIYNGKITGGGGRRVVFIPCKPNTTYTVQRTTIEDSEYGSRFAVGTAETLPAIGVAVNQATTYVGFVHTITTNSTAKYLVVWAYWNYHTEVIDSIQIELGDTATTYEVFNGKTYTLLNGEPNSTITTVLGVNNIFADVGNVTVGYYADTTLALANN